MIILKKCHIIIFKTTISKWQSKTLLIFFLKNNTLTVLGCTSKKKSKLQRKKKGNLGDRK